jgi:glycosyltransferase involved in cell wall biosynthesis
MADRILVFIPCYNCAPQIGRVIDQLAQGLGGFDFEVLIVDNGSKDGSREAAAEALPRLGKVKAQVVLNRENYNLGGSHKAAFAYADREGFSHVLVLHGDDQGAVKDALPVLAEGLHNQYDACLGARFMPGSKLQGYSALRILGNYVFNTLFTAVSGRMVLDLGSGLNIFGRAVFADRDIDRHSDDLRFNNFLLLGLYDKQRKVMFFPISWREDDQVSNVKMVSQALGTLEIAREYLLKRRAFRTLDHRATPREAYAFDVVATNPPAPPKAAAPRRPRNAAPRRAPPKG